jgi:predicted naringenin-chalcone synthase
MTQVYLNNISTAVPPNDVHETFVAYAPNLLNAESDRKKFRILTRRSQIEHRYSVLRPHPQATQFDADDFYRPGEFPATSGRMALYKKNALPLATQAIDQLGIDSIRDKITHVIVTSCTGFYAPGLDQDIIRHYKLNLSVERTIVGFMGCQAAINAMKLAYHTVRSQPHAHVLIVNLELCTLHLQNLDDIDQIMSFLIFADGCAASLVSADNRTGMEILGFHSSIMQESREHITWHIGDTGFNMVLARAVPSTIADGIGPYMDSIPGDHTAEDIAYWAVHPGGRAILDAVETGLGLSKSALSSSREILRKFGNMSSATVMFVLQDILHNKATPGLGYALAFGPGLTAEGMVFQKTGSA